MKKILFSIIVCLVVAYSLYLSNQRAEIVNKVINKVYTDSLDRLNLKDTLYINEYFIYGTSPVPTPHNKVKIIVVRENKDK